MKKSTRYAFTIFELLTILAILALLLALLLPAVAKVRQAAARTQSMNNLKQIALACHNYHDVNNALPPGNDANHFSAAARLLPYIEQNALFQTIDFMKPIDDQANDLPRRTLIRVFLSPLDPQVQVTDKAGATNYLFNAGSKPGLLDNNGVFYHNSKIKLVDITDGTSNTLLAGETLKGDGGLRALDVKRQHVLFKDKEALKKLTADAGVKDFADNQNIAGDRCGSWMDGRFLQGTFTGTRAIDDPKPDVSCAGAGGLSGLRGLADGSIVAMCDGSVRFVNKNISLDIFKLLTARDDGQAIPDF